MASRTAEEVGPFTNLMRIIFKHILMHICITLGLTGNILTLIVLLQKRMRRTSTSQYLAALTFFDSLYLISSFANSIEIIYPNTKDSDANPYLLLFGYPIADFSSNTSVYLIVMFTIERYVAVAYPLHSRYWCRPSRARKIILFTILFCFLITFPTLLENKIEYEWDPAQNRTRPYLTETKLYPNFNLYKLIYFWIIAVIVQFMPLSILIILNSILMAYIHNSNSNQRNNHAYQPSISIDAAPANKKDKKSASKNAKGEITAASIRKEDTNELKNQSISQSVSDEFSDVSRQKPSKGSIEFSATARNQINYDDTVKSGTHELGNEPKSLSVESKNPSSIQLHHLRPLNKNNNQLAVSNTSLSNISKDNISKRGSLRSNRSGKTPTPRADIRVHRNNGAQHQSEQHKATLLLIVTVVVFLVCQLPSAILLINEAIFTYRSKTAKDIKLGLNNIANGLIAINASINFILYSCISERFRQTFLNLFIYPITRKNRQKAPNYQLSATTYANKSSTASNFNRTVANRNDKERSTIVAPLLKK